MKVTRRDIKLKAISEEELLCLERRFRFENKCEMKFSLFYRSTKKPSKS